MSAEYALDNVARGLVVTRSPEGGEIPNSEVYIAEYGIPVWAIVGYSRASNEDLDYVAKIYDIPREYVDAAMEYYEQNKEAIDKKIVCEDAIITTSTPEGVALEEHDARVGEKYIPIRMIIRTLQLAEGRFDIAMSQYDIPERDVHASVMYYRDHKQAIDKKIEEENVA